MATMIVYSDANSDGYVYGYDAAYATARTTAYFALSNSTPISVGQTLAVGFYSCYEAFLSFDTSLAANVVTAALSLADYSDVSTTDFTIEARLDDYGTTLTTGDWISGASLTQPLVATYDTTSGWAGLAYHEFTDVAMVANLNLAGSTRLVLNSDRHRLNNTPGGDEYVNFYPSEQAGTTKDPKLVLTDDVGPVGSPGPVPDDDNVMLPWQQIVA